MEDTPLIFGPNGSVLDSEAISDELRARYEREDTFAHESDLKIFFVFGLPFFGYILLFAFFIWGALAVSTLLLLYAFQVSRKRRTNENP